jgi:O-acetyl-ADP-ribose deacetylase (regulator of RNase III)
MGGGLALDFKLNFPEMYEKYRQDCAKDLIQPGNVYLTDSYSLTKQDGECVSKKVLLFPTKYHYINPSLYEYVINGLKHLASNYKEWGIKSIAIPALGCGLGGLHWEAVKYIIEVELKDMSDDILVEVYTPQ